MTQTVQGMGKERRGLEEVKQRRPDLGDWPVEGRGFQSCVHGNFCLGRGQDKRIKDWSGAYQYG